VSASAKALLLECREVIEALWDCTCDQFAGAKCTRCDMLERIDNERTKGEA